MRKRKRKPDAPALAVERPDRGCVVTARRARWKEKQVEPTEEMIRMVRFIWMRELHWEDRHKLNKRLLGQCMERGLVWREPDHNKSTDRLLATYAGREP